MAAKYPPWSDESLRASVQVFLENIQPFKETLGLPEDFEAYLASLQADYAQQMEQAAQRLAEYREAVQRKEAVQQALKAELRRLARVLRAHPEFTEAMARGLGMPVRDREPTPIEPGAEVPLLQVEVRGEQHWVYFWHEGTRRGRRGKPRWARAARIVYALTEPRASTPSVERMQYLASATRSPYVWTPPREAMGQVVWYRAAWETPRGALGGWSDLARGMVG